MNAPPLVFATLCLIVAVSSEPALAASASKEKTGRRLPPAVAQASLRGPLWSGWTGVKSTSASNARQITAILPSGGGVSAWTNRPAATGLTGLRSFADVAPACRSSCAKVRIVCSTTDEDDCDPRWSVCVSGCSTGASQ